MRVVTDPVPDSVIPVELRAPEGALQMEIDWADGHTHVYPHRILRGFCPCASCQGHSGPIAFVASGAPQLVAIDEVGQYALRLGWDDQHRTGIYSFAYLRELGEALADPALESRTFRR